MLLLGCAGDAIRRAVFCAKGTPFAFFCDLILQQAPANFSRTGFVYDMGKIFGSEKLKGGKDRVWSSLPKPAKGSVLDDLSQRLQFI